MNMTVERIETHFSIGCGQIRELRKSLSARTGKKFIKIALKKNRKKIMSNILLIGVLSLRKQKYISRKVMCGAYFSKELFERGA